MRKLMQASLLIVVFVLCVSVNCFAQTTSNTTAPPSPGNPADSETLKALEITNIRLAAANAMVELLIKRVADKDDVIEAQRGIIAVRDIQLSKALTMDRNSQQVQSVDQVRLEGCQNMLATANAEINRLRNPGFFASLFDKRTLSGAIVGFGVGRATASQNPFVR